MLSLEKLRKLLDLFDRNKEWADIVNWLNKLNEVIKSPGLKRIPNEEILAKRLCMIFDIYSSMFEPNTSKFSAYAHLRNLWIGL